MKSRITLSIFTLILCMTQPLLANWNEYKAKKLPVITQFHGWCSQEKAERMMNLIHQTSPDVCVEIGVFGGSSVYPTAAALKFQNKGTIFAIDPWSKEECLKGYTPGDANYEWWSQVDLEGIYRHFVGMMRTLRLDNYYKVMRMKSSQAVNEFADESIDILHVDGNHSEESALLDVQMFLPKVKKGGYIWFDDANWKTTHKAVNFLLQHCNLDDSSTLSDPYLLFQKDL